MTTQIYSLSICGEAILNMHSLNNEGSEGNQTQTRMVEVMGGDGDLHSVNAVSGDMFKHIQAEHLHRIAVDKNLPMSEPCRRFDANRITADQNFSDFLKQKPSQVEVIDRIIETCAISSMEGILITEGYSAPRKSVVEFGWVVGIPEKVRTEQFFHAKYAPDDPKKSSGGSNLGQNIFHRPVSSGKYAAIVNTELARIGYNDISQEYVIDDEARLGRYKALLESLIYTFIQPNGAMRNTQMPHLVNFAGVVSYSTAVIPAPTVSPLNEGYISQCEQIRDALNKLHPEGIKVKRFESLAEFADILQDLIATTTPYRFKV